jgi:hypothetical protein
MGLSRCPDVPMGKKMRDFQESRNILTTSGVRNRERDCPDAVRAV